jgi:hypothetical protein
MACVTEGISARRVLRLALLKICSCSGPRLPDELTPAVDEVDVRPERWDRHDYPDDELLEWDDCRFPLRFDPGFPSRTDPA